MIKKIYLGSTGAFNKNAITFFSSKVKLVDSTGAEVPNKWVEVVAQGSDRYGASPRVVAVDQGPASDQP